MNHEILQIINYEEQGFRPLMSFEDWRLAGLNYAPECDRTAERYQMEKHLETDEVFVLMSGKAWLLTGENGETCETVDVVPMEQGVIYNVRLGTWHGSILERDAKILLVEKKDTGSKADTLRILLSSEETKELAERMKSLS